MGENNIHNKEKSNFIPKIIHYCWFGRGEKPEIAHKCIESWKKFLPDYEIKEWNEDNFDINIIPYTQEAYSAKKYAFVSDYARFWILYNYGGLFLDTDVEIIKPLNEIISNGAFMGKEEKLLVNPGLGIGCPKEHVAYKEILDIYSKEHFINSDGCINKKTIVHYTSEFLIKKGLKKDNKIQNIDGLLIHPEEYFCPGTYKSDRFKITKNTHSIHHYAATWVDGVRELKKYHLPLGIILKIYVCKEETRKNNILPKKEFIVFQFSLTKRRYIVITLSKIITKSEGVINAS